MKYKFIALSLLFAGSSVLAVNAQEKKATDNMYIGAGVGVMSVFNGGANGGTPYINIQFGKYITPTWGVRAAIGGVWQKLDDYNDNNKTFGELNLDATLNLNSLFGCKNVNRPVDVYLFAGPTFNISSAVSGAIKFTNDPIGELQPGDNTISMDAEGYTAESGTKLRAGATFGLGVAYNLNEKWAINLEGRMGVTPSIFGYASDCRAAEATGRLTVGATYVFGGKKFAPCTVVDNSAINEEVNRYRSELAQSQADLAAAKNALANVKPETKEVVKEIQVAGPRAIFFNLGSSKLDDYGKVNIQLAAKVLKANPDKKYKIAGYADKATGSSSFNQKLSEKRAQVVYDALVAEGVDKDQLELVGFGGTENMFGKDFLNRVVILE